MRKRTKHVAYLSMAAMMGLSMMGCGSEATTENETKSNSTQAEETKTDENAGGGNSSEGEREKGESGVYKTGLPIVDEEQTLKVMVVQTNPDVAPEDSVLMQEIAEQTGVKIEWEAVPKTSWPEKKGLLFANGDLPDVILGGDFTDSELLTMADGGQIIPLNDLIEEYGENFKQICSEDENLVRDITAPDGNIYGLPYYMSGVDESLPAVASTHEMLYINKDWLDKLGLEMPTTTDEFKEVLQAFKDEDANGNGLEDEVGLSVVCQNNAAGFDTWFGAFGIVPAGSAAGYKNIMVKDGKVEYAAVQPEYKEAIQYFHELWEAGLIDKECFTQDNSMWTAKLKNPEVRTVGAFTAWRGTSFRLDDNDDEYVVMPPLKGPEGQCQYPKYYYGVVSRGSYVITSTCENPELAMRWGDNLVAPLNSYQTWTDTKIGYNIKLNEAGNQFELIEPQPEFGTLEYYKQTGKYGITCVSATTMAMKPDDPNPLSVDNEVAQGKPLYTPYFPKEYYPNTFLSLEEAELVSELQADIEEYVKQMHAKWISEGGIEEEWDSYLTTLSDMGLEEYLAQYQSALDRYNAE